MNFPVKKLLLLLLGFAMLYSCSKESFTTDKDARLYASADSLHFDTVFTSAGSTSQILKIINPNKEGIRVSSVRLAGGATSPFRINVDGIPGPLVQDVAIAANDSAYVFVTVTIDPTTAALPFVVRDSLEIVYNGNRQWVRLDAYGRNAHFYTNKAITANEAWTNDLPYVILGSLSVNPGATLTIQQGCQVYVHGDAPIIVNGSLQVTGAAADTSRVLFTGDRLDEPYRSFPGSFPGLVFTASSQNNLLRYAVIKNAYQGIVVTDPAPGTKLTLQETVIDNAYDAGLLGINTSIDARNLLISNCGKNLLLVKGGSYNFTHCTLAAYSTGLLPHKNPVALVANYISQNNVVTTADLNAVFRNCIFWGESGGFVDQEVVVAKQGAAACNVQFDQVLWSLPADPANAVVTGVNLKNQPPQFDSVNTGKRVFSFRLQPGSPALNKGVATNVSLDLDGKPRPVGLPDLGAYERQ